MFSKWPNATGRRRNSDERYNILFLQNLLQHSCNHKAPGHQSHLLLGYRILWNAIPRFFAFRVLAIMISFRDGLTEDLEYYGAVVYAQHPYSGD